MKITKDIFLAATAEAMRNDSTKKLFKAEPVAFNMFSLFAFAVFNRLDGKDITVDDFNYAVASVIADTLSNDITVSTIIKNLALIIFSLQILEELKKNRTNQTEITRNMTASKLN